jgi:hypothetical protein
MTVRFTPWRYRRFNSPIAKSKAANDSVAEVGARWPERVTINAIGSI